MADDVRQLVGAGRYAEAKRLLLEAFREDPGDYETLFQLGFVCQTMKEYAAAEAYFRKALAVQPRAHSAMHNLGLCLEAQGDTANARECYANALKLKPDYAAARDRLDAVGGSSTPTNPGPARPTGRERRALKKRARRERYYRRMQRRLDRRLHPLRVAIKWIIFVPLFLLFVAFMVWGWQKMSQMRSTSPQQGAPSFPDVTPQKSAVSPIQQSPGGP
ncbi:MAG: tetratricopeptide repeat protein [Phycisphaerales bacterium]